MAFKLEKAIRLEARTGALMTSRGAKLAGDLKNFDSVYIGAEFCENLLPAPAELLRQAKFFLKLGKRVRVLTPLLTETGLARFKACLKALAPLSGDLEATVNDLGAAALARRTAPGITLSLGRLLYDDVFLFKKDILRLVSPESLEFLAELGISRFEISSAGRFPATNFADKAVKPLLKKFSLSVYYPYLNLSTARACMTGMTPAPAGEAFTGVKCRRECFVSSFKVEHPLIREELLVRGNTVFLEFPEKFYAAEKELERLRADRLVYCPFP